VLENMKIVENKPDKNRSLFMWWPSLITIKNPEGRFLVFAWGFYTLVLKDTPNNPLDADRVKVGSGS